MKIVDLQGDAFEQGFRHGEVLRSEIDAVMSRWFSHLESIYERPARESIEQFLNDTDHVATARHYTPELVDEVMGIAAGARRRYDELLAFNLMDEEWRYNNTQGHGCSFATYSSPSGVRTFGQNMDLPDWMYGSQVILRTHSDSGGDSFQQLIITSAGLIGLFGANTSGLAVCANTLAELRYNRRGMPVAFIIRGLLAKRTLAEARRFLHRVPHASGQHYAVGTPAEARGFECSEDGCFESDTSDTLLHTNHTMWHPIKRERGDETEYRHHGSRTRISSLESGLPKLLSGEASLEEVLSDGETGLCVSPRYRPVQTFASGVMTLQRPPQLRVALGRPDITEWEDVPW